MNFYSINNQLNESALADIFLLEEVFVISLPFKELAEL